MTKKWDGDVGRKDSGTPGRGTQVLGNMRGYAGTRRRGDVGHLNFALNLQFTIFGGQEKRII